MVRLNMLNAEKVSHCLTGMITLKISVGNRYHFDDSVIGESPESTTLMIRSTTSHCTTLCDAIYTFSILHGWYLYLVRG